jgi:hypothetical protein
MLRVLALFWPVLAVLAWALPCAASPGYPYVIQDQFALACPPTCLICHTQMEGGPATANTKLGIALRRTYKAACCDEAAFAEILRQLEADESDVDADGISDIAELQMSSDPNRADNAEALACAPERKSNDGCAAAARGGYAGASWIWALSLLLFVLRRSRARRARG